MTVVGVKLWLFGGIARLGGEAKTPGTEFRVAAAGPATSLAFAAVFGGVAAVLRAAEGTDIVVAVIWWLAGINVVLGLFNLLPGPLWTAAGCCAHTYGADMATPRAPLSVPPVRDDS
jgi:Zn-dependent protease